MKMLKELVADADLERRVAVSNTVPGFGTRSTDRDR